MPTRREFLRASGLWGLAALSGAGTGARAGEPWPHDEPAGGGDREPGPWFRMSLAQWSLHRRLFGRRGEPLDPFDFPQAARDFGLDAVEYVSTFYRDAVRERGFAGRLRARASDAGVESLLVMVDHEGALGDPDPKARAKAVDNHRKWIDVAVGLGCHSIRVNARSEGSRGDQLAFAADGLARLAGLAAEAGISVLVENHGGHSSDGEWLATLIRWVDDPALGTLPDFGNFRISEERDYDRYRGVRELMPFAKAVSAKSYDFDGAGNETTIDYRLMMRIVRDAGYRGYVGIEYEGSRLPEEEGIRATKRLLERVRDELAGGREK